MKEVAELLNSMLEEELIQDYALFGAVAQMRYTEAVPTLDADVLVSLPPAQGLDILSPIYRFCETKGYRPEGEAVVVGDWPVQFIPVFSPLTEEALKEAEADEIDGIRVKVVRADYLAVLALSVGRHKDHLRILALLDSGWTSGKAITRIADRHGLLDKWEQFKRKFVNA